jgi:PAS domain S-box-containing protein
MDKKSIRVLVVEDNPGDYRLVAELLKDCGTPRFTMAQTGAVGQALKMLQSEKFDVVLLDLNLPDSSGLAGLEKITALAPDVPVIVLTGIADENTGMEALQKRASDYLVKGQIDANLLCRSIRYAMERKRSEDMLVRERENLQKIFDSVNVGMLIVDDKGSIQRANKTVSQWVGKSISDCLGDQPGNILRCVHAIADPEGCGYTSHCGKCPLRDTFESVFSIGKGVYGVESEASLLLKGKNVSLWLEVNADPIVLDGKRHVIMALHDITGRKKIEEEIKTAHTKVKTVLESIAEAYIVWDRQGRFVEMNKAAEEFLGRQSGKLIGQKFWKVFPKAREKEFYRQFRRALAKNIDVHFEAFSNVAGRWFEAHAYPFLEGLTVYLHDISARKQSEEAIQRMSKHIKLQAENLKAILDSSPDHIYMVDRNLRYKYANPAGFHALGLSLTELIGSSWPELKWPSETMKILEAQIKSVFTTGKSLRGEVNFPVKSEGRIFEYIMSPVRGPDKLVDSVLVTNRDITARKQIEESLRQTRDYLESLFNYANAPIIVWDPDFKVIRFNRAFELLTGYSAEEVIGKELETLFPKEHRNDILDNIERTLAGEYWESVEIPILCKNGAERTLLWNSANIYTQDKNNLLVTIAQGQDITERKKAEESVLKARDELELKVVQRTAELMRAQIELTHSKRLSDIGALGATVAHELRNPLAAIRIAAFNIRRKKQDLPIDKHLDNIEQRVIESDQIISNLLFYSRLKVPHYETINIFDTLNDCVETAKKSFIKKDVKLSKKTGPLKNISIEADPLQMREVFLNIINNAFDAVANKTGQIIVSGESIGENSVRVSVSDNGAGIDEEHLERVFEPFFTTKAKGTGLGLTVCQQIVNMHRGSINIQSKKDKGTTVTITLPKKRE